MIAMMQHYQPEGRYAALAHDSEVYKKKLEVIYIAEFEIINFKAKWKLGQNRSIKIRREIARKFRERNVSNDRRCADEIERWIERNSR